MSYEDRLKKPTANAWRLENLHGKRKYARNFKWQLWLCFAIVLGLGKGAGGQQDALPLRR